MESDFVLQDFSQDTKLTCITQQPGLNPVCLQKWSLRLASWKYKTKSKHKYKQTGTEIKYKKSKILKWLSMLLIHTVFAGLDIAILK